MPTRICSDQNGSEAEQAMLEGLEHSLGSWHMTALTSSGEPTDRQTFAAGRVRDSS